MSKPKNLTAYPTEYQDLFQRAVDAGQVRVVLESKKKADELRLWLYGFRKALLMQPSGNPELALMIEIVEIIVEDNVVTLRSRDKSPMVTAMREALGKPTKDAPLTKEELIEFDIIKP